jgi:hypothetical protein
MSAQADGKYLGASEPDAITAPANDGDWTTVSEDEYDETKIVFDTIGDEFVGVYLGPRQVPNEDGEFTQHRFAVGEDRYFVNGNHSLNQGMRNVAKGTLTRLTYASDRDTGAPSAMKVYRVDVNKKVRAKRR